MARLVDHSSVLALVRRAVSSVTGPVIVGVSGGSDSMALLLSLALVRNSGIAIEPIAVTVDHGLRAGSADEAKWVAAISQRLGIAHVTRQWTGTKPGSGIQAVARRARRELLAQAAGDFKATAIFVGHTLDDQFETVAMRAKRGIGPGIAGISPACLVYDDKGEGTPVWMVRPLLGLRRAALRSFLNENGQSFIDDPSNDCQDFERVRVRQDLAGVDDDHLVSLSRSQMEAAHKRVASSRAASGLIVDHVSEASPGLLRIRPGFFRAEDKSGALLALQALVAFAGGTERLAPEMFAQALLPTALDFPVGGGQKPWRKTSNGCVVELRNDGIWLLRERRAALVRAEPFDGRYRLLGKQRTGKGRPLQVPVPAGPASLVRTALAREPAIATNGNSAGIAWQVARSDSRLRRLVNPWPDLVPGFDVELAQRLSEMAGEGSFPGCPIHFDDKK